MGDTKLLPEDIYWSEYPERIPGVMYSGSPRGVMAVHKPTAIKVICDHLRSQHENRDACLRALSAALLARQEGEDAAKWITAWRNRFIDEKTSRLQAGASMYYEEARAHAEESANQFETAFAEELRKRADAARSGGGG